MRNLIGKREPALAEDIEHAILRRKLVFCAHDSVNLIDVIACSEFLKQVRTKKTSRTGEEDILLARRSVLLWRSLELGKVVLRDFDLGLKLGVFIIFH